MADPSKTERATPKRRNETRQRGQVAKSVDLSSGVVALASFVALQIFGLGTLEQLQEMLRGSILMAANPTFTLSSLPNLAQATMLSLGKILFPFMAVISGVGLLTQVSEVGLLWTTDPIRPRLSKLNPLTNLKRTFLSLQSVMQLIKGFLKLVLVGTVVYLAVKDNIAEVVTLGDRPAAEGASRAIGLSMAVALKASMALLLLGIGDYIYQRRQFFQNLKMTKQEVKDEAKQAEGDPKVKGRQRRVRLDLYQRMMQHVPTADVVITNPTHYAVALKYDTLTMDAPRVVAKGRDLVAQRIKEIAAEHGIPTIENVPLAQALFKGVPVGREIPAHLYQAVAEILAFVFRVRHGMAQKVA